MRIIAGRLRHRKLLSSPGNTTRPIIDRAKVMLFDRIRDRLPQARVADLFSGTGTLGLEALSRGAQSVVFVERDHRAYALLRQNVAALGVSQQTLCWRIDLRRCSLLPKGEIAWTPYDVVFFDPPYAVAADLQQGGDWHRCLVRLARPALTSAGALLVVRTPRDEPIVLPPEWLPNYEIHIASMTITLAVKGTVPSESAEADVCDDQDDDPEDAPASGT
jgi:16S rRNA (guanine966-N2)-methyltransferase